MEIDGLKKRRTNGSRVLKFSWSLSIKAQSVVVKTFAQLWIHKDINKRKIHQTK